MTRSTRRLVALFAGAALVLAACGGGGSDESSGSNVSAEGSTSGGSGSGSSGSGDSGSSGSINVEVGGGFDGSVQACGELSGAFAALMLGPSAALFADQGGLEDMRKQLSGQTLRVPDALKDQFETLDAAYAQITEALDGVTLSEAMNDPAAMERVDEATSAYDTDEVQAALDDVGRFLEENCTNFGPGDFGTDDN